MTTKLDRARARVVRAARAWRDELHRSHGQYLAEVALRNALHALDNTERAERRAQAAARRKGRTK